MIINPDDHPKRHTADDAEAFADARRRLRDEVLADPNVREVTVMVGAPGSGKSHWAKANDRGVILDQCNADAQRRRALAQQIRKSGKRPIAVYLKTGLAECQRRNAKRQPPARVPPNVIVRQLRELAKRPPRETEGWAEVVEVAP